MGLLLIACKTIQPKGSLSSQGSEGGLKTLDPNGCASLYDRTVNIPSVDPATLTLSNVQVSPVEMVASSGLYLPKLVVQTHPNADVSYYKMCNPNVAPSVGCVDGVVLDPVPGGTGFVEAYVYTLPSNAALYGVEISACVRQDRVSTQGTGTQVIRPTQYPDLELFCGPAFSSAPYMQVAFPNSTLSSELKALNVQDVEVNNRLYAMVRAIQTYATANHGSQSQLAALAATFAQYREDIFPLVKSSLLTQALQSASVDPSAGAGSLGLAESTTIAGCVTNGQLLEAIEGATGTFSPVELSTATPTTTPPPTVVATAPVSSSPAPETGEPVPGTAVTSEPSSGSQVSVDLQVQPSDIPASVNIVQLVVNSSVDSFPLPSDSADSHMDASSDATASDATGSTASIVTTPSDTTTTPSDTTTTPSDTTTTPSSGLAATGSGGSNTGAIAGGVIGGVIGVLAVAVVGYVWYQRSRSTGSVGSYAIGAPENVTRGGLTAGGVAPVPRENMFEYLNSKYTKGLTYVGLSPEIYSPRVGGESPTLSPPTEFADEVPRSQNARRSSISSVSSWELSLDSIPDPPRIRAQTLPVNSKLPVIEEIPRLRTTSLPRGFGIRLRLASTPEQVFLAQFAALTQDFLTARTQYLAMMQQLVTYLASLSKPIMTK